MPVAFYCAAPRVVEEGEFAFAADNWTCSSMRGRKSAFSRALAKRFPYCDRLTETLDPVFAEEGILEEIRGETVSGWSDNDGTRLCQRLQSRREVGSFADDRFLACSADATRFADND